MAEVGERERESEREREREALTRACDTKQQAELIKAVAKLPGGTVDRSLCLPAPLSVTCAPRRLRRNSRRTHSTVPH